MHVLQINLDKKLYVFCNFPNFEKTYKCSGNA